MAVHGDMQVQLVLGIRLHGLCLCACYGPSRGLVVSSKRVGAGFELAAMPCSFEGGVCGQNQECLVIEAVKPACDCAELLLMWQLRVVALVCACHAGTCKLCRACDEELCSTSEV